VAHLDAEFILCSQALLCLRQLFDLQCQSRFLTRLLLYLSSLLLSSNFNLLQQRLLLIPLTFCVKKAEGRAETVRSNQRSSNTLYCRVNERVNSEMRRDSCSSSLINFVLKQWR
jgi:hypothetical protein